MFVSMNCVTVAPEQAEAFEQAFLNRERHMAEAPGFVRFQLMRPLRNQEYLVVTEWESEQAFEDWVSSDLFKRAHRGDGQRSFGGHSELRTYEIIDVEQPAARS
ncbi:MAG TPA: antibiotic biosynthesis monooxygenase [Capillimicrobium sp.]|nr:antibiotic biosynthesis monooxygenase [Capillimicrobium sp.]